MRILILNTLYPPLQVGGAEKSVSLLAEALARAGDQVTIVSLHESSEQVCEERNGVRVYRVPLENLYWPFSREQKPSPGARLVWHLKEMWNSRAAARFGAILDAEKPDVVHTNNLTGFSVAVWKEVRRRRIRLVHTLRDYTLACLHEGMYRNHRICQKACLDCRAYSILRKPESAKVDAVVSNSEYVLKAHQQNGFFRNTPGHVIYNIADLPRPVKDEIQPGENTGLTFGFIGLVDPKKGIEVVLKATRLLQNQGWKLKIAGRGLQAYIAGLKAEYPDPRIEWLGFVTPDQFYRSIDVSLIASLWPEPLPRTLIESYAYGRSAICADAGGTGEITHLGKTVAVYSPQDEKQLAALMDAALEDPVRWRNGGFLNESSREGFKEDTVRDSYRAVYMG